MLTEFQQRVLKEAKAQLEKEPWYRGVCIDSLKHMLPSMDFEDCVNRIVDDTFYQDGIDPFDFND